VQIYTEFSEYGIGGIKKSDFLYGVDGKNGVGYWLFARSLGILANGLGRG